MENREGEKMNKGQKYEKIAKLTGIIIGLVLVLGISYAVFKTVTLSDKTNEISAGKLDLRIEHEENEISLENSYPIEETEGLKKSPYVFDVVNKGTIDAAYDLYIEVDETVSTLPTSVVRYYLTVEEDGEEKIITPSSRILGSEEIVEKEGKKLYKIDRKYINTNKSNKYKLYLWIDYDATVEEAANKYFEARVVIEGEQIYDKNRLVKQIDVSEAGDNSVVAYMYADGRAVLKGKGTIASNLSDTLIYDKEGVLDNYKTVLLAMGCDEEEVKSLTTVAEAENYTNNLSEEKQNAFYTILYKDVLEEMGYDTNGITDMDTCMQYLIEQGFMDESGNMTEKGEEFEQRVNEEYNSRYTNEPTAPKKIELEEGITNIPTGLFTGNENIRDAKIPTTVTKIEQAAFENCSNLRNIVIPDSVISIEGNTFWGCAKLSSVVLSSNLIELPYAIFAHCTSLVSIKIPESITKIGSMAFGSCENLTTINLPSKITEIRSMTFYQCTSLTTLNIPDMVTTIGDSAFNRSGLTSIYLPNSVITMGVTTFEECRNLTTVHLSENLTGIGRRTFSGCVNLIDITIPNSVKSIGDYAFASCVKITEIKIPESVISIGTMGFSDVTSLTIPSSIISLGTNPFGIDNVKKLRVDASWNYSGSVSGLSGVEELTITGKGVITSYATSTWYNSKNTLKKVIIEEGITTIQSYSFSKFTVLEEIELPNTLTSIRTGAFEQAVSLKTIDIPNSVTSVANYVFSGWTENQTINIDNTEEIISNNWDYDWNSNSSAQINYLRS